MFTFHSFSLLFAQIFMGNSQWLIYCCVLLSSYFPFIYEESGVAAQKAKYGSWFDYTLNPRSQIFRRDHSKVVDIQTLLKLMK